MPPKGFRATHCKRGHAFTEDNILWSKGRNGEQMRTCRQCLLDKTRARRGSRLEGPSAKLVREERIHRQQQTGLKQCSKCGMPKPLSSFKAARKNPDGLYGWCRACCTKRFHELNTPERRATAARRVRDAAWGLSDGEYDSMLEAQGGGCAICGETCKSGRSLAVDHDHASGQIRGLLCGDCNRAIGMMADSPERLRSAADYVERPHTTGKTG
jgi:hypothetical protein